MRKWMLFLFMVILVMGFSGCAGKSGGVPDIDSQTPDLEDEGMPDWGLTLSVENVSPSGMTLICSQSGGEPTGELQTGSDYKLIVLEGEVWNDVPTVIEEYVWTSEAYLLPAEDSRQFDINWEWLYGKLPAGTYRILKGITDFRGSGDYDSATYYAEFEIP